MVAFTLPSICSAAPSSSWGPPEVSEDPACVPENIAKLASLPYQPFGRNDRLGRVADFTGYSNANVSSSRVQQQGGFNRRGGGGRDNRRGGDADRSQQQQQQQREEEASFQLVDTTKAQTQKRFVNPASKRRQQNQRLRQINARRQQATGGAGLLDKMTRNQQQPQRKGKQSYGRGGFNSNRNWNSRVDRVPSVSVQSTWTEIEQIDLNKMSKNLNTSTAVPTPEDLVWCGFLDPYNDLYDKVSAKQPVPLKKNTSKEFYPVATTDDPVIEKFAVDGHGQVFITDAILSQLMMCGRSVFPWDIVVHKLSNGVLFFDKRDNSQLDYLTVQETSSSPPNDEDGDNSPDRLGLEATAINQNFSQQVLKKSGRKKMAVENPFYEKEDSNGMEPASVAYRYRKFVLDDNMTVIVRTELHGIVKNTQYMTAFALNEFFPSNPTPQNLDWRDKIDNQRGAVLASELKNNSFKLAKWTVQSLLASADVMKIGFVSRTKPKNVNDHVILGTQFYRPKEFAMQINVSENQMWAMFRMFIQLLDKCDAGKYVLMRHPNKASLHLYAVPPDTFEEED